MTVYYSLFLIFLFCTMLLKLMQIVLLNSKALSFSIGHIHYALFIYFPSQVQPSCFWFPFTTQNAVINTITHHTYFISAPVSLGHVLRKTVGHKVYTPCSILSMARQKGPTTPHACQWLIMFLFLHILTNISQFFAK